MAENPIKSPLPADLPIDWAIGQTVGPDGADVGLSEQHGYNYLNRQVNAAQEAVNAIGEAFEGVAALDADGKIPEDALPDLDFLPLSGGSIDGDLSVSGDVSIKNGKVTAGTDEYGPYLEFYAGSETNSHIRAPCVSVHDGGDLTTKDYVDGQIQESLEQHTYSAEQVIVSDETAAALGLKSVILSNLLPDSSFENGGEGWGGALTSYIRTSSSPNRARTGTVSLNFDDAPPAGAALPASMSPAAAISPIPGHVYYMSFFGRGFTSNWINCTMSFGGISAQRTQMYPADWTLTSARDTAANQDSFSFLMSSAYGNAIDDLMIVDLTAAFGAGKEPDKDWCDENIPYFEGTYVVYDPTVDEALRALGTPDGTQSLYASDFYLYITGRHPYLNAGRHSDYIFLRLQELTGSEWTAILKKIPDEFWQEIWRSCYAALKSTLARELQLTGNSQKITVYDGGNL